MKIEVFSSGSDGNSTLIRANMTNILVDVGLSKKMIEEYLSSSGLSLNDIDAILITHEHVDHIKGLMAILNKFDIKIYLTEGTLNAIVSQFKAKNDQKSYEKLMEKYNRGIFRILRREKDNFLYEGFNIKDFYVQPLPTFHDARESVGFVFTAELKRFVYITDTGYVHNALFDIIKNADGYLLESNHDPDILLSSNRPYQLKMRILSDYGHLSNLDSMLTLVSVIGNNTKLVLHAHVSTECNLSQIIELEREKVFKEYQISQDNIKFVILKAYKKDTFEI